MSSSISTDKLLVVKDIIKGLQDTHRLKSITVAWKILESEEGTEIVYVPSLHVEYYERSRPKGVEVELSDNLDEIPEVKIIEGE